MAATALFVLLWGSAAIFTRWGLDHGSVLGLLIFRFALALAIVGIIAGFRGQWLPAPGTRAQVALTGVLMIGVYSIFYFQSIAHGVTPGLLSTILGVQPILTLLLTERRFSAWRLIGLLLALAGLTLVVYESLAQAHLSWLGMSLALTTLLCMTVGALMQKKVTQAPLRVLPLQYLVTLALCLLIAPFQPVRAEPSAGFLVPLLYLAIVISVIAQLLLYRMISKGNLVNVTSLFYLVPIVTVMLDYLVLGNALAPLALLGMGAIIIGLLLVFRTTGANAAKSTPVADSGDVQTGPSPHHRSGS